MQLIFNNLKGVQRPAAFAIVCLCFCEFRTVSYSGSCGEQVADFAQGILVFVLPLKFASGKSSAMFLQFHQKNKHKFEGI